MVKLDTIVSSYLLLVFSLVVRSIYLAEPANVAAAPVGCKPGFLGLGCAKRRGRGECGLYNPHCLDRLVEVRCWQRDRPPSFERVHEEAKLAHPSSKHTDH